MSKRILFISHKFYPEVGGIEINSEILAEAFLNAGNEVKLVTWSDDPAETIFPFQVIRKPDLRTLIKAHRWAEIVFENNPTLRLSWPSIFFGRPLGIALCIWINRSNGEIGWQDKLKKLWLHRASAVIAVSNALRDRCWPAAIVIPNPYREDLFQILPEIGRDRDFVFLGRLVSDKGADFAIRALANLISKTTSGKRPPEKLSLTIIGDGPQRQFLHDLVNELGLQDNVKFTGALRGNALVSCLNKHRYMLVPSMWEEPFGNVALEGMACGCVPIVSDGGGLPDAVGNAGITFKRGDLQDFTAAIRKVLNDKNLDQQFRLAAKKHLDAHHTDIIARRYLDVIENFY